MNQFARQEPARSVEYGNPFELLLDRAYKPQELKAYKPMVEPTVELMIDVCAYCGEIKCRCPDRRIIKIKMK